VEPIEPNGPYGAKGIGEPALNPTMAAITNAIYNAVGIRIRELPVSPERLLAELKKARK
jgi:CO/xanthine dehydrogenase Mo-binding subunit